MALPPGRFDDPEGDIARAAGNVQYLVRRILARIERGDQGVLPEPVQAPRHDIVHDVVAFGDLVEHVVDEVLLLALGNLAEAVGRLHAAFCGGACFTHRNSLLVRSLAMAKSLQPRYLCRMSMTMRPLALVYRRGGRGLEQEVR
jgi:hypothetical protein